MRNGPGQYSMGSRRLEHAFDGYAKPHNVRFEGDGGSTGYYTTKFIRSQYYLGIYFILYIYSLDMFESSVTIVFVSQK